MNYNRVKMLNYVVYNSFDFKQNHKNMIDKKILVLVLIFSVGYSFVVQARRGWRKCFRAEHSPDKTLQVKFGFPRRHRQNCDVRFSVQVIEAQQQRQTISSQLYKCHQMQPTQPAVIKHTSEQYTVDGYYRICAEVLDDRNQDLVLQIHIGEKLNPLMYGDQQSLPLIQAQQLIDLDLTIQSIKKSLGWSQKLATQCTADGDKLDVNIQQMQNFAMNATILQIIFLIAYGIFWIVFMKSQKRNGSEVYDTRL